MFWPRSHLLSAALSEHDLFAHLQCLLGIQKAENLDELGH